MIKRYNSIDFLFLAALSLFMHSCGITENNNTKKITEALLKNDFETAKTWIVKSGIVEDSIKMTTLYDTNATIYQMDAWLKVLFFLESNNMHEISSKVLKNEFDVNYKNQYGESLLYLASSYKIKSVVKLLVEKKAIVNGDDINDNKAPLIGALENPIWAIDTTKGVRTEIIEYLLQNGATPVPYFIVTSSIYNNTSSIDKIKDMNLMIKYNATLTDQTREDKASVLQLASQSIESVNMITFLAQDAKMNLEYQDKNGWTALHYASEIANTAAVRTLVNLGANKNARTNTDHCLTAPDIMNGKEYKSYECYKAGSLPIDVLMINFRNTQDEGKISTDQYEACLTLLK